MANPIPLLGNTVLSAFLRWSAANSDPELGTIPSNSSFGVGQPFRSQIIGNALAADQIASIPIVVPAGGSTTLDLSAALKNVLLNTGATFGHLLGAVLWMPSVAQSASLGSNAKKVYVGASPSAPCLAFGLADGNSRFTVWLGEFHWWLFGSAAGYLINSNQSLLLFANQDLSNQANLYLAPIGLNT